MPISNEYIIAMAGTTIYNRGEAYFRQNRVKLTYNMEGIVAAEVQGSRPGKPYLVFLEYSSDKKSLNYCECSCPAFEEYGGFGGVCKHVVATMLKVENPSAPKIELSVKSDNAALQLLNIYTKEAADEAAALYSGNAIFEPVLEYDRFLNPSLFFRAGVSRMYVIPDLSLFKLRFDGRLTTEYGKSFALTHNISSFTEESRPFVSFFLKYYDSYNYLNNQKGLYYGSRGNKRNMYLSPAMTDEFFSMYDGKHLTIRNENKSFRQIPVVTEDFRPQVILKRVSGGAMLTVQSAYALIEGDEGLYVLSDGRLSRCGRGFKAACGHLLQSLQNSKGKMFFSDKDIKALLSVIIKKIEPYVELKIDSEFDDFKTEPLVTKIYLDAPEANGVTAKMTYTYGDNVINALDEWRRSFGGDIAGEALAKGIMTKYFGNNLNPAGDLFIKNDPDAVYLLVSEGLQELSKIGEIYLTDAFRKLRVRPPVKVSLGVRINAGLLDMDLDLGGLDLSELSGILDSYRMAKKYHRLKDGSFLSIQESELTGLSELVESFGITSKQLNTGHIEMPKGCAMYLDEIFEKNEEIYVERNQEYIRIINHMKNAAENSYEIPAPMDDILRGYQKEGFLWLKTIEAYGFGGILADDMGLGKTLQILALLKSYYDGESEKLPSIVVCPSSLMLNWESEAAKFAPELRAMVIAGVAEERASKISKAGEYDLLITSYDLLKRDIELYESARFRFIAIDEAQYIKNQYTQNAKAVKALQGQVRLALTGTPVENSLAELWSIFDFLMPGYLFSYGKFRKQLEEPIVKNSQSVEAERLKAMVKPFMLRRLKSEVLKELPPKTETVLRTFMDDEQKKIYTANLAMAKNDIGEQAGKGNQDRILILAALTRLRQICCDPSLVYENYKGKSAKLDALTELIESCQSAGRRMLIFSGFTSMLDIIGRQLEKMDMEFLRIDGSTPSSKRLDMVNEFNEGNAPVFLISLKAGGTGLNLTGADVVIHYDPWWNLSAQNQATDRAHRIGQEKNVQVYKLIAKDTLEERILYMQEKKAELAGAIIEENINPMERLNRDELLSLFEG